MLNAGQFLISRRPLEKPDFIRIKLTDGYYLHYHKKLPVYIHPSFQVLLLGTAWQAKAGCEAPIEGIERLVETYPEDIPEQAVLSMEEGWCGRYVLIVQERVYLDATGLLGVFYSKEGISSSCLLLAECMELPEKFFQTSSGLNWLPGPLTQYAQIRRLLPSQIYNYGKHSLGERKLLAAQIPECVGEEDRIREFVASFAYSLKNMARIFPNKKFMIALTGGYDSRTLLALADYAGIPFECFTLGYEDIPAGDVEIPEELCRMVKCGYTYIPREKVRYSKENEMEYTLHTGGLADDGDKQHYVYGQYQELVGRFGEVVLLRSAVWEVAVEYIEKAIGDRLEPESLYDYYKIGKDVLEMRSLEEYFGWTEKSKQTGINAATRFYWEQRSGSWLSSIEQSFDLMEGLVSLNPLNSRFLITQLLGFPKEERIIKAHQLNIISYIRPELANVRFSGNRPANRSYWFLLEEKIKQGADRLHRLGLKKTARIYKNLVKTYIKKERLKKENKRNFKKGFKERPQNENIDG